MRTKEWKVICQYCGSPGRVGTGKDVGWGGGKRVWLCSRYPECDAYVGTHPDGQPLGHLANPELRRLRREAHAAQRQFVRARGISVKYFYAQWLPQALGMPGQDAHISRLKPEVLRALIGLMVEEREPAA